MLLRLFWGSLALATPMVAQAQANNQYDSEALLEAMEIADTQGIEVGADGCAIQIKIEAGTPRIRQDNSKWNGECVNGLVNGIGRFTINGKHADFTAYAMGIEIPKMTLYKGTFFEYKGYDGTIVRYNGPEEISDAPRNGMSDYVLYEKVGGEFRLTHRLTSLSASCYTLPNHDKNNIDLTSAAAVENYNIMLKECQKVREAQWDHRTVEVIAESWFAPELGRDVEKYYICRFNKWTGTIKDKDQVYCNSKWDELKAAFKPRYDVGLSKHKQWVEAITQNGIERKATIGGKYATAVAMMETRKKQKKQEETALSSNQIQSRQQAFLAGPKGAAFRAKAGGTFIKPATTDQTAILYLGLDGEGSGYDLQVDDSSFGLPAGVEPSGIWYATPEAGKTQLAAELTKLSKSGVRTVYILYMDRMDLWEGPVSFSPRAENVLLSSTTSANPDYARVQREMQQAKYDYDRAQAAYYAVASRANNGGYGTSTADVLTGVTDTISASKKLENARTRYETLNRQFSGMSAQNTSESRVNVTLGDVNYRSELRRPLVILACDLVTAMCSEKERLVNHSVTVRVPMAIVPGEAQFETRKAQVKTAQAQLFEYQKKLQFGFSLGQLGDFMNGTTRAVPQTLLIDYLQFANKKATEQFEIDFAQDIAKNSAVNASIAQAATTLPQRYDDVFGIVSAALGAKQEAERKQGLQGLE